MLGASCFALGIIPAYVQAVGRAADATTFFVGSLFFTSASYCQLVQAQSPGMTGVGERGQHARVRALPWRIAWLNMLGSVAFMVSAIAGFVVPSTDAVLDLPLDIAGTLIGGGVLPRGGGAGAARMGGARYGLAARIPRNDRPRVSA